MKIMKDSQENEIIKFNPGATLFKKGEASDCMYIIEEGEVQIYLQIEDDKIPLGIAKRGEYLGELSCLSGGVRSATAKALTEVKATKIRKQVIEKLLTQSPPWMLGLVKVLSNRIHDMNEIVKRNKLVDEKLRLKMASQESRIDAALNTRELFEDD